MAHGETESLAFAHCLRGGVLWNRKVLFRRMTLILDQEMIEPLGNT